MNQEKKPTHFAVLYFWYWSEISDKKPSDSDYILGNIIRTNNFLIALNFYAETPCPASQLVEAYDEKELERKIKQMIKNFKNKEWIKKHIEPYI